MMQHKAKTVLTVSGFHVPASKHLIKLSEAHDQEIYKTLLRRPARDVLDKHGDCFYICPAVNALWAELVATGVNEFDLTDKLIEQWGRLIPSGDDFYDILWKSIIENTNNTSTRVEFVRKLVRMLLNSEYDNLITFASTLSSLDPSILTMRTMAPESVVRQRTEYTRISDIKGFSNVDLLQGLLAVRDPYGAQNGNSAVMGVLYTIFGQGS